MRNASVTATVSRLTSGPVVSSCLPSSVETFLSKRGRLRNLNYPRKKKFIHFQDSYFTYDKNPSRDFEL